MGVVADREQVIGMEPIISMLAELISIYEEEEERLREEFPGVKVVRKGKGLIRIRGIDCSSLSKDC